MKGFRQAVMFAGAVTVLCAPLTFAAGTDGEFKCESKATQGSTKYVASKSKCVIKCLAGFWKGDPLYPESDCLPPYGGVTLACLTDPLKGADTKFIINTRKNCDATFKPGKECPACYSGGDCSDAGYAGDYAQTISGQVDSFVPGVGCERVGATAAEQKCQTNTAKVLTKQVSGVVKCYIKCFANARKGIGTAAGCQPPTADPIAAPCIAKVVGKTVAGVNKLCGDIGAAPDNCGSPYPDGAAWANLVDIAISGNIPGNFCTE